MTNEEIISKLIELGQNMYHAYSYLKDDASKVKSAMEEWHKFVALGMQEGRVLPGMEQIDIGVAWRDYVPVDAFEECERYGKWKIVPVEPTRPVTKSSDQVKNKDLEEEIQRYLNDCLDLKFPTRNSNLIKMDVICTARHFANWQREKILHDAIYINPKYISGLAVDGIKKGDEVRLLIIKED